MCGSYELKGPICDGSPEIESERAGSEERYYGFRREGVELLVAGRSKLIGNLVQQGRTADDVKTFG